MEIKYNCQVTFVTAFMNIYNDDETKLLWRIEKFREIAETGISLCVYVDKTGFELLPLLGPLYPNMVIMPVISLEETMVNKICNKYTDLSLPRIRNESKDTFEYLILMNSKIEFLNDAIEKNPWQSTHFAWIDFNVSHVFSDIKHSTNYLKNIYGSSHTPLSGVPLYDFLAIPGCWGPIQDNTDMSVILDNVHWRFCGGFLIGDRKSIIEMYQLYYSYFPTFIEKYRTLVWEVNFWAWLEGRYEWFPNWFSADHNDSIIVIPTDYTAVNLSWLKSTEKIIYNFPNSTNYYIPTPPPYKPYTNYVSPRAKMVLSPSILIPLNDREIFIQENPKFVPCSSTFITYKGHYILNTRYINYELDNYGNYIFHHPENKIITKNMLSILDYTLKEPNNYTVMSNPPENEFISKICNFHGLEDIRLFEHDEIIKFIATSINYSPNTYNSMIIGTYDVEKNKLCNCIVIDSPRETVCEKNWTPIHFRNENDPESKEMYFIYQWSPMEIGYIDQNTFKLNIIQSHNIDNNLFRKFRGSTTFVKGIYSNTDVLIGMVHFSEGNAPRHYFHTLIMLHATTLKPIRYTKNFYFNKIGIEFCIGMTIRNNKYHFWFSQNDCDPMKLSLDITELPFYFTL